MLAFYQDFINHLEELHKSIALAIECLPPAALDWIPGEGMNSISVLVVHLTGAECYWIGDVALGDASNRNRAAEFQVSGIAVEALRQRLADASAYAQGTLSRFTLTDLEKECISPRDGRKFTVGWALMHALEHTALHLGHIQLTCQLWGQQKQ